MDTGQGSEFDWDEHNLTHLSRHKITAAEFEEAMRNNRVFMDVEDEGGEERWYVAGGNKRAARPSPGFHLPRREDPSYHRVGCREGSEAVLLPHRGEDTWLRNL